jgi:hypothetical protein
MIRKGEILGVLKDPQEYFDSPRSKDQLYQLEAKTALLSRLVDLRSGAPTARDSQRSKAMSPEPEVRVRTDFGSGVPPAKDNTENRVHVRDEAGGVPDGDGNIASVDESAITEEAKEEEPYGPKTAAMPNDTVYPSERMRELLDVRSLPKELKERAWKMLQRRVKAFGFDG